MELGAWAPCTLNGESQVPPGDHPQKAPPVMWEQPTVG